MMLCFGYNNEKAIKGRGSSTSDVILNYNLSVQVEEHFDQVYCQPTTYPRSVDCSVLEDSAQLIETSDML